LVAIKQHGRDSGSADVGIRGICLGLLEKEVIPSLLVFLHHLLKMLLLSPDGDKMLV